MQELGRQHALHLGIRRTRSSSLDAAELASPPPRTRKLLSALPGSTLRLCSLPPPSLSLRRACRGLGRKMRVSVWSILPIGEFAQSVSSLCGRPVFASQPCVLLRAKAHHFERCEGGWIGRKRRGKGAAGLSLYEVLKGEGVASWSTSCVWCSAPPAGTTGNAPASGQGGLGDQTVTKSRGVSKKCGTVVSNEIRWGLRCTFVMHLRHPREYRVAGLYRRHSCYVKRSSECTSQVSSNAIVHSTVVYSPQSISFTSQHGACHVAGPDLAVLKSSILE